MKKLPALLLAISLCFGPVSCVDNSAASSAASTSSVDVHNHPWQDETSSLPEIEDLDPEDIDTSENADNTDSIPPYSGKAYIVINDNIPVFSQEELTTVGYEKYSELDQLGRCGVALASCGKEIMPKSGEERGSISSIKPSGWVQAKYDWVDGKYLYNRCHLIGWQLSAENANKKNLITGTRYMNTQGMLPFENMVADYIKETGNHVAYRITPIYSGDNLVASGVQIEAYSIEDEGDGICFNVYCYNAEPGVSINYTTGASSAANTVSSKSPSSQKPVSSSEKPSSSEEVHSKEPVTVTYILNTSSRKFHYSTCGSAARISAANRAETDKSRDELVEMGYSPCGNCDP